MQKSVDSAIWNLFQAAKDSVNSNVTSAVVGGQLKVDRASLPTLLSLITASMEQAYSNAIPVIHREITAQQKTEVTSSPLVAAVSSKGPKRLKKNAQSING